MSKKRIGVHACWLDKDCRQHGVPAFTSFSFWWVTIRINPPKDNWDGEWDWNPKHLIQVWRNRG